MTKVARPVMLVILLVIVVVGWAQGATEQAEIRSPSPGGVLYWNEVIEVALEGLLARDIGALVVNVWAHPVGREREKSPISRCGDSYFVPVVQTQLMPSDVCAAVTWADPARERATLWVRWNHKPERFADGDYLVKVEIFVQHKGCVLRRWAETPWHPLRLVDRPPRPPLQVVLVSPKPGSAFRVGERVRVQGQVINATPPGQVWLQVRQAAEKDWHTVTEGSFDGPTFDLVWNTSQLLPGSYGLMVNVRDVHGYFGSSTEVGVELKPVPPCVPQILIGGEPVPPGKVVRARDLLQFGIKCEDDQWASFRWEFGDGTVSLAKWPLHTYVETGTFTVCLTAWPEPEFRGTPVKTCVEIVVRERPAISVHREIYGFPVPCRDEMSILPGTAVSVRLVVRVMESMVGISITETAPTGWNIKDPELKDDPRLELLALPRVDGHRITWVVTSREPTLVAGMEFSIVYTLSAPVTANPGSVDINGEVHVQVDPARTLTSLVQGRSVVTVLAALPVCVAIAYLERLDGGFRLKTPGVGDTYLLSQDQIKIARELIGREVPHTAGAIMTPEIYLRLRAYYEAKVPVTACPKR